MNKVNVNEHYKEAILRALEYHFPGSKVYLFGSRARGDQRSGSDIDIAIDTGNRTDLRELNRARITLENLPIPLNIDLVDLQAIPKELRDTIAEEGILWKS
jgi:predicted nucleotidyltransferase